MNLYMNIVKKTESVTDCEDLIITMQEFSSTVSFSPSFSFCASGGLVEAAVRVVHESESYYSVKVDGNKDDHDAEFEFETLPLHEEGFFHFPTTTLTFKHSSDDDDVAANRVTSKDLFYGGWNIDSPSLSCPSSQSHSSSESDDLEIPSPTPSRYHCFSSLSPITSPARGDGSKIKSSSAPKRCRLKEFLRRSHSDGAVSTSSTPKRCSLKNLLRRSHSDGGEGSSISPGSPVAKEMNKPVSYKPEVNKRRKSYLPYRQNLIGVFTGMSRFEH